MKLPKEHKGSQNEPLATYFKSDVILHTIRIQLVLKFQFRHFQRIFYGRPKSRQLVTASIIGHCLRFERLLPSGHMIASQIIISAHDNLLPLFRSSRMLLFMFCALPRPTSWFHGDSTVRITPSRDLLMVVCSPRVPACTAIFFTFALTNWANDLRSVKLSFTQVILPIWKLYCNGSCSRIIWTESLCTLRRLLTAISVMRLLPRPHLAVAYSHFSCS